MMQGRGAKAGSRANPSQAQVWDWGLGEPDGCAGLQNGWLRPCYQQLHWAECSKGSGNTTVRSGSEMTTFCHNFRLK